MKSISLHQLVWLMISFLLKATGSTLEVHKFVKHRLSQYPSTKAGERNELWVERPPVKLPTMSMKILHSELRPHHHSVSSFRIVS